jgi:Na+/phosphate symporter
MITIVPALVALVGLLLYLMASNPKAQEIGRILFFSGVFVTLLGLGSNAVKLF